MQAQDMASPVEQDRQIEGAIISLLLDSLAPLSTQEVQREIGDEIAATDALTRLHRAGLVHRFDQFVFATRSAAYAAALNA